MKRNEDVNLWVLGTVLVTSATIIATVFHVIRRLKRARLFKDAQANECCCKGECCKQCKCPEKEVAVETAAATVA